MAFTVKWLGQGGFSIALGDKHLVIDPYLSDSVIELDGFKRLPPIPVAPGLLEADLILTTHDHMDHLDPETIGKTRFDRHLYAGPETCARHYRELGIPEERIRPLHRGDCLHLGDARLFGVFADHTEDSIGLVVAYHGVTMYFVGDSLFHERLSEVGVMGVDILFTCINGKLGNMTVQEAAQLAKGLPCRVAVPVHWGMFAENTEDPQAFASLLAGSGVHVEIPEFDQEVEVFELLARSERD